MRLNLQIKLLTLVSLVVVLISAVLVSLTISAQRQVFQDSFRARAVILAQALDANISKQEELQETEKLCSNIYKLIWLNPEIIKIEITLPSPEGMKIVASNNVRIIGTLAEPENKYSFEKGLVLTKTLSRPDGSRILSVITPVHVGGQRVGTYDISLSLETEDKAIAQQQKHFIAIVLITIISIITILSITIRGIVITPILEIERGLEKIGKGDLNWRITPKSKDEIGDLAQGVNRMAEELKDSYITLENKVKERTKELEEAKTSLEIKVSARTQELEKLTENLDAQVKARTKELQEKIKELEKLQKLFVGRELKMVELKKELDRSKNKKLN